MIKFNCFHYSFVIKTFLIIIRTIFCSYIFRMNKNMYKNTICDNMQRPCTS